MGVFPVDVYVHFTEAEVVAKNLKTGRSATRSPVVRALGDVMGFEFPRQISDPEVVSVVESKRGQLVNGLGHPRILVGDFFAAAFAIQQTVAEVVDFDTTWFGFRHINRLLLHARRTFPDGLTHVETQAILDLATLLKPRRAIANFGPNPLSDREVADYFDAPFQPPSWGRAMDRDLRA